MIRPVSSLARRLLPPDRAPDVAIGGSDDPYLRRWYLWPRNRVCNAYLHQVLRDDDPQALHDHPWPSVSILLSGRLGEIWRAGDGRHRWREARPGVPVWRSARFAHRLVLPGGGVAWTLFLTGPRLRDWGFWCPQGWRHWREFTAPGDSGRIGRGCGEK